MDEFNRNFGKLFVNRYREGNHRGPFIVLFALNEARALINEINEMICAASGGISATEVENTDFNNEFRRMEGKINYYKAKLRSCREKYKSVETSIHDARKRCSQKGLFVLDDAGQSEEENLHERLRDIHLSHDACVKKSNSQKNPNETIRANIGELTLQRNTLMEELMQLRRNADDNDRKLARVNAMITEQETVNSIHRNFHRSTSALNQ